MDADDPRGANMMRRPARKSVFIALVLLSAGANTPAFEPELIERLTGPIDDHAVVLIDASRAIVAWERNDGPGHETVWSSRRNSASGWSVPENVEFSQGKARDVQLAVDGNGNATVVWVQDELGLEGLWSNRYVPGEGWRDPSRIEPVGGELYAPRMAFDVAGRGVAVWERRQGTRLRIRASVHTPDTGWGPPREIDTGDGDGLSPQVSVHADGGAIVAWTERVDDAYRRVVARHFSAGNGWGELRTLSADGEDAYDVQIGMDAAGNAFATWEQAIHDEETVFASRFDAQQAVWSVPVRLEEHDEEAYGPRLAVNPDGQAVVAWIRAEGEIGAIVAARFRPDLGWERPIVVQGGAFLYVFDLDITAGPRGQVLATWCQTDGSRNNVWFARLDGDSGWHPPALGEHRTGSAHRPRAAAARDGSLGLVWKMVDAPLPDQALYSLWYRRVQ